MKQRILITGSTGFIGNHLLKRLEPQGFQVVPFKGDLQNLSEIKHAVAELKPSVIYHLGAVVDLSRNYDTAIRCIDINIKGTLNLLESLRDVPPSTFIYTSTEEVYGESELPYTESQIPNPPSPYAVSKIAAEQLINLYAQELMFSAFLFRIGTTYGPNQPASRFIPQIILKALKNEPIPLNSGKKKRDYIFIDDVIDALLLPLTVQTEQKVETYNLGGSKQYSLKEMVSTILTLTNSTSQPLFGSFPDRIFEADEWLLDISKAKRSLYWEPKVSLKQGLQKMIDSYR